MTEHFDHTRWNAMQAGTEALAAGEARCRGCGINPTVITDAVRVSDGQVYPQPDGGFYVLCSACEKVTSR